MKIPHVKLARNLTKSKNNRNTISNGVTMIWHGKCGIKNFRTIEIDGILYDEQKGMIIRRSISRTPGLWGLRSRIYLTKTITDADYAGDIAILANAPVQAETLLHSLERASHVNAHKMEYM